MPGPTVGTINLYTCVVAQIPDWLLSRSSGLSHYEDDGAGFLAALGPISMIELGVFVAWLFLFHPGLFFETNRAKRCDDDCRT
jgi:hypothetical protein